MAAKRLNASVTVVAAKPATLAEEERLMDRVADLADAHDIRHSEVLVSEDGNTLSYDWLIKV
jgi:hypothetical protein